MNHFSFAYRNLVLSFSYLSNSGSAVKSMVLVSILSSRRDAFRSGEDPTVLASLTNLCSFNCVI